MKNDHTPAPWTIEQHGATEHDYALYSGRAGVQHGLNIINMSEPHWNWGHDKPLIEAAPDLIEALERLYNSCILADELGELCDYVGGEDLDCARLAIAKAREATT